MFLRGNFKNMEVGDWVNSYSAGIWRIYRIQNVKSVNIHTKECENRTAVFSARFLNSSFKRSFSQEVCNKAFVYPLENAEQEKLNQFILENPKLMEAFNSYKPKPLDSIYNANIVIPDTTTKEELEKMLISLGPKTHYEIYRYLLNSGIGLGGAKGLNAQFVCPNHKANQNGELLYEFSRSFWAET